MARCGTRTTAACSTSSHPRTCPVHGSVCILCAGVLVLDGFERLAITINGGLPGPAIEVYEGAEVVVHVINNLINNALTMHWCARRHRAHAPTEEEQKAAADAAAKAAAHAHVGRGRNSDFTPP